MPNPAPGFQRKPEHRVAFSPAGKHITATLGGVVVAESDSALLCEESNHEPVYYIPMTDCRVDQLIPTSKKTYCPYKGEASYWTLSVGDASARDAAWSYDTPYDEALPIKGHVAFYTGKLDGFEVT